mmetsp:Transcript_656/g.761  ORF Transcript_656/g.761 Transcript_656/m.761 type:complete len:338 (+) Transcript_656:12-1025(+)|eukprot:CAMPEP_0205822464 /NCGR_PEP_ID=MMETSP0206-20130828/12599_1 /ASSEMBLY_ACC=CAM_ASM_000279 /TAXON_ID=36767 /ORGANISM="Euplotes focardii, Strain TN1" /LENGTH=337 /DNA_ID=CAMNT_0053118755 /DNA_START=5 /DNA_END=1018 /DNA_ORIENTATION=+
MATEIKEKEKEKLMKSTQFMEESFQLINQERFGLFSQPGNLSIGENTYAPPKLANKDEDGRVTTEPPNFLTTKVKKGDTDDVLFSAPSYVTTGDPYNSKKLVMRESKKDGHTSVSDHAFKPAKTIQNAVKSDFEHLQELDHTKKNYRDAEGAVITAPSNFVTTGAKLGNPATTPGTLFTKEPYGHMKDEYDRKKELNSKELAESKKKMQEKPFSQRIKPQTTFNTIEEAYGEEGLKFPKKKPGRVAKAQVEHTGPFKPSNPGKKSVIDKTLAKFPDYLDDAKAKEDPNFGKPRRKKTKKDDEKPAWRPNTFEKSKPSPSVATNLRNIRSSLPTMMRR